MSDVDNQDPEKGNTIDGQLSHHPSAPIQPPQGETNIGDSSGPLFTTYSNIAEEEDNKTVERWQKDAEGIIIFTGLFSAVIAAIVVVSVQDLRPNSQDVSAFYLEKMYQLQLDPNASRPSVPSAVDPPAFTPPRYAVWMNSLLFLSLVISLSCAMLATSLQQWARRYLKATQPKRCNPQKRARSRAFFANGIEKFHVSWAVDALPTLVHLSLFIFFAGLLIYLFNIDHTVFNVVVCWVALLSTVYGFITFLPIFRHDCPYFSPLSSTAWYLHATVLYTVLKVLQIMARLFFTLEAYNRVFDWRELCRSRIFWGLEKQAEAAASMTSSEIDGHILEWTVDSLDEDDALGTLIGTIPGFYKSDVVKDIPNTAQWTIALTLGNFLDRTLSSNAVSESVKKHRLIICLDAAGAALDPLTTGVMFKGILDVNWNRLPDSIEIGSFLMSRDKSTEGRFAPFIFGIIAKIVATVRERDDRWIALYRDHLDVPEAVLRGYITQGDSLLLANLVHYTRGANLDDIFSRFVVISLSELDMHNTLPGLQHDFCDLWNKVVREARRREIYSNHTAILRDLRHLYIALHRGTDAAPTAFSESTTDFEEIFCKPSSYPLCNIPGHQPQQTHHIHDVPIAETTLPPSTA